jgi:hypothetical protein
MSERVSEFVSEYLRMGERPSMRGAVGWRRGNVVREGYRVQSVEVIRGINFI